MQLEYIRRMQENISRWVVFKNLKCNDILSLAEKSVELEATHMGTKFLKTVIQDTSGCMTLPAARHFRPQDTSGCKTFLALKLFDTYGPEVFGQVRPETSLALRQVQPQDKFGPKTSPALIQVRPQSVWTNLIFSLLLSFCLFFTSIAARSVLELHRNMKEASFNPSM